MENVYYLGMIIIGGMGSIPGVFFGVVFIMVIDEILLFVAPSISAFFPGLGMDVAANLSFSIFGIIIVLFLIFEPRGLYHRWNIVKSSLRLYPFTY
jgi:branched-chain amino acid transport system permease protein